MKALIVESPGKLAVKELPIPKPGLCQALVKMKSCGVCGTDMKIIHGELKNFNIYPAILGHEGFGEVVQVGPGCTSLHRGDRVVLPYIEGKCGEYSGGFGAFAQYALVGDAEGYRLHGQGTPGFSLSAFGQTALRPTDIIGDVEGAMLITFREVLSAMGRFGCEANKSVAVFGMGPVGLCFVRYAKLLGLSPVIAIANSDEKAQYALAMGADFALNNKTKNVALELRAVCPNGVDFVIDAAGQQEIIAQAMGLIADHGKVCVYGVPASNEMRLDWSAAPYNWTLDFLQWPVKRDEAAVHNQVMAWIALGALTPGDFISDVIPFESVLDAFKIMEERRPDRKKIIVRF
ncbi:MAG: zinc-binding dehydrogenase [Christensenellaceae bacterium]|jgi:threonine dehydrogenase-like Zn-dependent dehydrogenase|nr:zinc-binding dehydrogenase [Christensenellaceae bacterium]